VDLGLGGGPLHVGAHPVHVVDDVEDDRQPPQRGEVERLVPGARVDRSLAQLAQHGALLLPPGDLQRHAGGHRQMPADDPPAAEEVQPDVEQVHRAAAPVRGALDAAEQLRHHRVGVHAQRQREAVVAVGGHQHVVGLPGADRPDVGRLLPGRQMAVAADLGRLVLPLGLRLEGPDQHHQLEELAELRGVVLAVAVAPGGRRLLGGLGRGILRLHALVGAVVALIRLHAPGLPRARGRRTPTRPGGRGCESR
jgi:hypothetical protein